MAIPERKLKIHVGLPAHQLTMTVLMTSDTANFSGNVHGGHCLDSWISRTRLRESLCGRFAVTVSSPESIGYLHRWPNLYDPSASN